MKLRLSEEEIRAIRETASEVFGKDVEIILFGSRLDLNRHGGDIDLLVKTSMTPKEFVEKKFEFIYKLWQRIGQQKIDVVYYNPEKGELPIHRKALSEGIKL